MLSENSGFNNNNFELLPILKYLLFRLEMLLFCVEDNIFEKLDI
jgi:hypothetical protein